MAEIRYCEGWDPEARRLVGSLTPTVARARDEAGEQYAVALVEADRPTALVEVARRHHYFRVWWFDERLRRTVGHVLREVRDDRLFLTEFVRWRYEDGHAEFDEAAWMCRQVFHPSGRAAEMIRPAGGNQPAAYSVVDKRADEWWWPAPAFGDWLGIMRMNATAATPSDLPVRWDPANGHGLPPERRPWHPPVPLQPSTVDDLFRTDSRHRLASGVEARLEVRTAGRLRMPSGRLVVADPSALAYDDHPFTVTVDPGEYPVDLSVLRWGSDPAEATVAAARLLIGTERTASWELAVQAGQEVRTLDEGEFFGFESETGLGCLVDAAAAGTLAEVFQRRCPTVCAGEAVTLTDPSTTANLIMFATGRRRCPTWIGRSATGQVTCFVTDTRALSI